MDPNVGNSETRDQLYKIGLPGKSILGDYFQEKRTSQRPFLALRISFPGRPILYNCLQIAQDPVVVAASLRTPRSATAYSSGEGAY